MKLGYARVSTDEQSLEVQIEQLKGAGCGAIFPDKQSGKTSTRPGLDLLFRAMEGKTGVTIPSPRVIMVWRNVTAADAPLSGDGSPAIVIVTKLDRLARSTTDALFLLDRIGKAGGKFVSLGEPWLNTDTPYGKLMTTMIAGFAEFERSLILQRTAEGRAHARKNGVKFGPKFKLTAFQRKEAQEKRDAGVPVREIARSYNVDPETIYRLQR